MDEVDRKTHKLVTIIFSSTSCRWLDRMTSIDQTANESLGGCPRPSSARSSSLKTERYIGSVQKSPQFYRLIFWLITRCFYSSGRFELHPANSIRAGG